MQKRWIWPFELLEKIGEGGMGVVYRARYVVDDRQFAVKLLPVDVASDTILSRFERELEILKTLRHPNIVHCFGGTCEGEQRFYAMELVEGGTLDRMLSQKGRLSWDKAVGYSLQMCSALAYAHERGVIHRDIKPGNFLMTPSGQLKLSDFGLATVQAASKITAAGKTMGTFPYMAPEQIRGKPPVSARTDLYALGCVLFEMIAGRPPFVGNAPVEVMHKHLKDRPPHISSLVKDCPSELGDIILHLMEKEVAKRPVDAVAVAQSLKCLSPAKRYDVSVVDEDVTQSFSHALPSKERRRRPRWELPRSMLVSGGIAAAVVLVLMLVMSMSSRTSSDAAERLWVEAFQNPSGEVRRAAARALGKLGNESDEFNPTKTLMTGITDSQEQVRREVIAALGQLGADARPAIASLIRVQKNDESELVRAQAAAAVQMIQDAKDAPSGSSFMPWLFLIAVIVTCAVLANKHGYLHWERISTLIRPPSRIMP